MKKITIEITENKYYIQLELGDKKFIEKHSRTGFGVSGKSVFEEADEIPDNLYEALTDLNCFQAMNALEETEEI